MCRDPKGEKRPADVIDVAIIGKQHRHPNTLGRSVLGRYFGPFIIADFVEHDSRLRFRSLNHVHGDPINPKWPVALLLVP
jgi:hypothetical protein